MKITQFLLTIIITAAISGGLVYLWQQSKMDEISGTSQLLSLDSNDPLCTTKAVESSEGIGSRTIYPVANEYSTSSGDYHNLAGLFTAAACGEERVDELFQDQSFSDVVIFTNQPDANLATYLSENGFSCTDETQDQTCERWYNASSVNREVLVNLRDWSQMITGSDCVNCG